MADSTGAAPAGANLFDQLPRMDEQARPALSAAA